MGDSETDLFEFIQIVRGQRVMLDADLAKLYGVETKQLKRAVKRHGERFPKDFMFQLENQDLTALRCQIGTSKKSRGGSRYLPYAFTEQGVAMLSSVLNSSKAIQVNIKIMRIFVRMRQVLSLHQDILKKIEGLESVSFKNNEDIQLIFDLIKKMMTVDEAKQKKRIGFFPSKEKELK